MVVPFLVLAIGVDDGFIMLHCWAQTDSKKCVEERCAEMLKMAGPSMSITSLTNFLSFTIGIWTPVPAIRMQVFVNNPGDMRNKERITEIMLAVKSFERAPGSVGGESTHLWLKTYIPFIGFKVNISLIMPENIFKENGSMQFQYKYINEYLSLHEYRRWYQFIRLGKQKLDT
uniref:SSD domain-containing protein n=1 Tax=Meloidogyne hapla TaxID=6305 RepID=A0A1I8BV23_MELHA